MMDYNEEPCCYCGEKTVLYLQYIGQGAEMCESCGEWQDDAPTVPNPDHPDNKHKEL